MQEWHIVVEKHMEMSLNYRLLKIVYNKEHKMADLNPHSEPRLICAFATNSQLAQQNT